MQSYMPFLWNKQSLHVVIFFLLLPSQLHKSEDYFVHLICFGGDVTG